jgi:class 3 adenylate cyclase
VEKYEGAVDRLIGDEIMALFGVPVTHDETGYQGAHLKAAVIPDGYFILRTAEYSLHHFLEIVAYAGL